MSTPDPFTPIPPSRSFFPSMNYPPCSRFRPHHSCYTPIAMTNRAEQLLDHALRYSTPCCSAEGLPCANDLLPVRSLLFRDWLADSFHREYEHFPSTIPLRSALQLFEAKARRSE